MVEQNASACRTGQGTADGGAVGSEEGNGTMFSSVGWALDISMGRKLGTEVGSTEGSTDGSSVGDVVGADVISLVGKRVGIQEGADVDGVGGMTSSSPTEGERET